jgi:hypothetical protein
MIATFEDARLLFARWKDDASTLRIKMMTSSLVFEAVGTVTEYTFAMLQLSGPAWQITLPIEGAQFRFSDPREIPIATIRDIETAKYEFGLAMELKSGDRLVLLEEKSDIEPRV